MSTITTEDGVEIFHKDWGPKNAQPSSLVSLSCFAAGNRRSDPRRTAVEGAKACRYAGEWAAYLGRPEGDWGFQQLTRSWSERFGLGTAQLVPKLKQTAGSLNLSVRLCTEAGVLTPWDRRV
jgi:hypothetical protein